MNTFEPTPERQVVLDQYMFHSTQCPCGVSVFTTWCVAWGECSPAFNFSREEIIDMHNDKETSLCTGWGYPDDSVMYHFTTTEHEDSPHCCNCGAKLNDDGTTGPTYAELENECMKLTNEIFCVTRDAYINNCLCLICKYKDVSTKEEPCKRCVGKNEHMSGFCWKSSGENENANL